MNSSASGKPATGATHARTYYLLAPLYDLIFDLPFHPGRMAAAKAVADFDAQANVLVVGVGTGLELELLPATAQITGIDLAEPMLAIARERVAAKGLRHVKALRRMDAAELDFASAEFDLALAPYVLSVVPNPAAMLDEMWRVIRPGGEIVLLNHFAAARGLRARAEAALEGAGSWLGWHPNFPFSSVGNWLEGRSDAVLVEQRAIAPFKLFTLLRIRKAQV